MAYLRLLQGTVLFHRVFLHLVIILVFFGNITIKKKRHKHLLMGFEFCSCYRGLIDRFHMPDVLYVAFRGNKKIINNNVYLNPINFASVLKMVLLFVRKDGKIIDISKNKLG